MHPVGEWKMKYVTPQEDTASSSLLTSESCILLHGSVQGVCVCGGGGHNNYCTITNTIGNESHRYDSEVVQAKSCNGVHWGQGACFLLF